MVQIDSYGGQIPSTVQNYRHGYQRSILNNLGNYMQNGYFPDLSGYSTIEAGQQ